MRYLRQLSLEKIFKHQKKYSYGLSRKNIVLQDSCDSPGLTLVPGDLHLCGELYSGDQCQGGHLGKSSIKKHIFHGIFHKGGRKLSKKIAFVKFSKHIIFGSQQIYSSPISHRQQKYSDVFFYPPLPYPKTQVLLL